MAAAPVLTPIHLRNSRRVTFAIALASASFMISLLFSRSCSNRFNRSNRSSRYNREDGSKRFERFELLERLEPLFSNLQLLPNRHRFLAIAVSRAAVPDGKGDGYNRGRLQCDCALAIGA